MSTAYLHAVASVDGYIADEDDDVGPLHTWSFNGDRATSAHHERRDADRSPKFLASQLRASRRQ